MPYIDLKHLENDTQLRKAGGRDILTVLNLIRERARLHYVTVQYRMVDNQAIQPGPHGQAPDCPVPEAPPDDYVSGSRGSTLRDPLYGEPIPESSITTDGKFLQPHAGNQADAPHGFKFHNPVPLKVYFVQEAPPTTMFNGSLEEKWEGTLYTSLVLLDDAGVTMRVGDRFSLHGTEFEILDVRAKGRWGQTSLYLHLEATVKRHRQGA